MSDEFTQQSFRVPRADRSLLAIPNLEAAATLIETNRSIFESAQVSLHDCALARLRSQARREALAEARAFTSSLIQVDVQEVPSESLVVSGHQPELFHVGVWAKNFALAGVARQCQSVAVNLVIDNDTLSRTSIRIPVGSRKAPRIERLLFDAPRPTQPWEEAVISDREQFLEFGRIVHDRIFANWGYDPLVGTAWNGAIKQSSVSERLCDALTALRANVERSWGQHNLELPMSRLCTTESFYWFAAHLLIRLPEVHAAYNETVTDYRKVHHLRNRMQPVPNLESANGWFEAPFWIWKRGDFQRGRLFARRSASVCELRDEKEIIVRFPWTEYGSLDAQVGVLKQLADRDYRLRTRALTTTLFARVCLADLFLHGIGGAKYDEMTDQLCWRLFGLKAPRYLTVSATLHLPLGGAFAATEAELCKVKHQLRDLTYNPDRHLANSPPARPLIQEKFELLRAAQALRESDQLRGRLTPEQHRRLATIHAELRSQTQAVREQYESERVNIEAKLSANLLIGNREYSFILYPEEQLRQFLVPLANITSQRNSQEANLPLDNGPPPT